MNFGCLCKHLLFKINFSKRMKRLGIFSSTRRKTMKDDPYMKTEGSVKELEGTGRLKGQTHQRKGGRG